MASSTGLAGLAVTGIVAALVGFGTATLSVPRSSAPPGGVPAAAPADPGTADLRREMERLRAEIEELRSSRSAALSPGSGASRPPAAATGEGDPAGELSPDGDSGDDSGPLPADRRALIALIDSRIGAVSPAPAAAAAAARKRMTLEEAGKEMGLTPFEIDAARRVYRESEDELLLAVMGTTDRERIREEVLAMKEDPDRKEKFIQGAVGGLFRNIGKMATLEDRRRRALKQAIGEEKAGKLAKYDLKPTFEDDDLEGLLEDVFD